MNLNENHLAPYNYNIEDYTKEEISDPIYQKEDHFSHKIAISTENFDQVNNNLNIINERLKLNSMNKDYLRSKLNQMANNIKNNFPAYNY